MATTTAAEDREEKQNNVSADEGVEALTPYKGSVAAVSEEFCAGIRSGLSYCGGHTISKARDNAEFIRVAQSAKEREGFHANHDWEGVNVDSEVKQVHDSGTEATVDSDD